MIQKDLRRLKKIKAKAKIFVVVIFFEITMFYITYISIRLYIIYLTIYLIYKDILLFNHTKFNIEQYLFYIQII